MDSRLRSWVAALVCVAGTGCVSIESTSAASADQPGDLAGGAFVASVSFSAPTQPERVDVTLDWAEAVERRSVVATGIQYDGMIVTSAVILGVAHDGSPPTSDSSYSILGEQPTTTLPTTKTDARFARCLEQGQSCTYAPTYTVRVMLRGTTKCPSGSPCTPHYVTKYVRGTVTVPAQAGTEEVTLSLVP